MHIATAIVPLTLLSSIVLCLWARVSGCHGVPSAIDSHSRTAGVEWEAVGVLLHRRVNPTGVRVGLVGHAG